MFNFRKAPDDCNDADGLYLSPAGSSSSGESCKRTFQDSPPWLICFVSYLSNTQAAAKGRNQSSENDCPKKTKHDTSDVIDTSAHPDRVCKKILYFV